MEWCAITFRLSNILSKKNNCYLLSLFKQLMRLYVKNGYIVCIVCIFLTALYVYKMNI